MFHISVSSGVMGKTSLYKNNLRKKVWSDLKKVKSSIYCHSGLSNETYVPPHTHTRGQLIYTEGGRVYIEAENRIWYLPARHYMWIPAGVEHSIKISMPSVLLWMIYFPAWKNESVFFKTTAIYPVNNLLLELIYFTKNWKGHITKENETRYFFASGLKALLPEISKRTLPFDLPIPKDEKLQEIILYIHDNLPQNILIKEIAQKFEVSASTIARLFKKDLKMSFISYLGTLRILRSIELLATGKMNIKEICFAVGYESIPTFSNVFKKVVGVRPTEYLR